MTGGDGVNENDFWEIIGSLEEDESQQVLLQLFTKYEQRRKVDPKDTEAENFFNYLEAVITQVRSCNVNRR